MIREVKKEHETPRPKKRGGRLKRLLALLVTAALVVGAVYLVTHRDRLNFDALKRWFTYRSLAQRDDGTGEPFPYQGGGTLTLTHCGGDLLSVSQTGVRLYSSGGAPYIEDTFSMDAPVCQVSGDAAVVYDAGGSALKVYRDRARVFELEDPDATVLSARLSQGGYLSVVTRSSGYKGVISVYDSDFRQLVDLRLSSAYVLDAVVSPDGRSLLAVTAGQSEHQFSCALARYSLPDLDPKAPAPVQTWTLGNHLPLDLVWDGGGVRVLGEYAALTADGDLEETGRREWSGRYLKRYSLLRDNAFAVLTGKYRSGSQTTLELIDRDGEVLAAEDFSLPILDLSAAGKYVGVLTSQSLTIYTGDLEVYATVENSQGASRLVMLEDGSAYLIGQGTAWLYLR